MAKHFWWDTPNPGGGIAGIYHHMYTVYSAYTQIDTKHILVVKDSILAHD